MAQRDPYYEEGDPEAEGTIGMALGFRIIEYEGGFFLVEAEIAPYIDETEELGVTLVFHPLDGINPVETDEEVDWQSWPIDIDHDLTRDSGDSLRRQFAAIVRQLHGLDAAQLRRYLERAKELVDAGNGVG